MKKKILIIGTEPWSLVHFRGKLIEELINKGYEPILASKKFPDSLKFF